MEDWQLKEKSVLQRVKHLLDNPVWADCKFLVGTEDSQKKEFEAHRLLLSISSPVFAAMLYGNLAEIQSPIKIVDVKPEAFRSMLEYIYTDTFNIETLENAIEVYQVANKYILTHLQEKCWNFIWESISCKNAICIFEFAEAFNEKCTADKALEVILKNTSEVLSEKKALDMSMSTLLRILDQDKLNINSEMFLFETLAAWILHYTDDNKCDEEELREIAKPAIQKIRFLTMSVSEFASGPAKSALLTKDQAFAVLMNLSTNTEFPLPVGFSESCTRRFDLPQSLEIKEQLLEEFFIWRTLNECTTKYWREGKKMFTEHLGITVSEDIFLLGVQVPVNFVKSLMNSLKEKCLFYICNADGTELEQYFIRNAEVKNLERSAFDHDLELELVVQIMFTDPMIIPKDTEKVLGIKLPGPINYLRYIRQRLKIRRNHIQFVFKDYDPQNAVMSALIWRPPNLIEFE